MVGERPRYIPLKPSFLTIPCRLVMITLPDISTDPERESLDQHATNFNKTKKKRKNCIHISSSHKQDLPINILMQTKLQIVSTYKHSSRERERECRSNMQQTNKKIAYKDHISSSHNKIYS